MSAAYQGMRSKASRKKLHLQYKKVWPGGIEHVIRRRLRAALNFRVGWHLKRHLHRLPPVPAADASDGVDRRTNAIFLKRRQLNQSITHFRALLSLSRNTPAEKHGEWEERIGYCISNSESGPDETYKKQSSSFWLSCFQNLNTAFLISHHPDLKIFVLQRDLEGHMIGSPGFEVIFRSQLVSWINVLPIA